MRSSNSCICFVVSAGPKASFARWLLVVMASCLFVLSSAFTTLSSRSSTNFSRWDILFYWTLFRSFWSSMSVCSYVISPSIARHSSLRALFLSSWSNLTSTAVSYISDTFFSKALPAVCTTSMDAYASVCHANAAFCFVSTFDTNVAWPRMFATTCSRKRCTSWI